MQKKLKNMSQVKKFKLYKSKSQWVVATMAFVALGFGATVTTAHAETTVPTEPAASVQPSQDVANTEQNSSSAADQQGSSRLADNSSKTPAAPTQAVTSTADTQNQPEQPKTTTAEPTTVPTETPQVNQDDAKGDVYQLGNADTAKIEATKQAAELTYRHTGKPQTVTAVEPTAIGGVKGSMDHQGNVTISGGTIDPLTRFMDELMGHSRPSAVKSITIKGPLRIEGDASGLFSGMNHVTAINGLDKVDTSAVTNMNGMFANDSALTALDLSHFNFNHLKRDWQTDVDYQLAHMLDGTTGLTKITVNAMTPGKWNHATTGIALVSHAQDETPAVWQNQATGENLDVNRPVTKPNVAATYVLTPIKQPTNDVITPRDATILEGEPTPAFTATNSGTDLQGLTFTNHDFYFIDGDNKVPKTEPTAPGVYEIHFNAGAVERIKQNNPKFNVTFKNFGSGTFTIKQKADAIVSFYDEEGQRTLPDKYKQTVTGAVGENPYTVISLPANYELTGDHPGIRVHQNGLVTYDRKITNDETDNVKVNLRHHHTIGTTRSVDTINLTGLPKPRKLQVAISWRTDKDEVTQQTTYSPDKPTIKAIKIAGYTPESEIIPLEKASTQAPVDRTINFAYTPNTVTANVKIPSNGGPQTVKNVTGKTGEHLQVAVPAIPGYTADKQTVSATVNPDGTITVDTPHRWKGDQNYVTYTPNDQTITVRFVNEKGKFIGKTKLNGKTYDKVDYGAAFAKEQELINTGYTPKSGLQNGLAGAPAKFTTHSQILNVQLTKINNVKVTTTLIPSDTNGDPLPNTTPTTVHDYPGTTVNAPAILGYTPVNATFTIPSDRTQIVKVAYTPNQVTADVPIPSNLGPQTMLGVTGKTGDQLQLKVPVIQGYTADKEQVSATVNPNGTITVDEPATQSGDKGYVTYAPNQVTADVPIPSNRGPQIQHGVTGKTGDRLQLDVPVIQGYTADKEQVSATVNPDGTITVDEPAAQSGDKGYVTYTPNDQSILVKFFDEMGNELDSAELKGKTNEIVEYRSVFDMKQRLIHTGYTPKRGLQNGLAIAPANFADHPQIFHVHLAKINNVKVTTTLIPSNQNGEPLPNTTPTTVHDYPGTSVKVPLISGYTATSDQVTIPSQREPIVKITYLPNEVTASVTIPSNQGAQTVPNVTGKTGEHINVIVPSLSGYTADKATVSATVNPDGTITVDPPKAQTGDLNFVTYTPTASGDYGHVGTPGDVTPIDDTGMPAVTIGGNGMAAPTTGDNELGTGTPPATNAHHEPASQKESTDDDTGSANAHQTPLVSQNTNPTSGTNSAASGGQAVLVGNSQPVLSSADATGKAATKLPQTSDANHSAWALLGMGVMSLLSLLGITKRKKTADHN